MYTLQSIRRQVGALRRKFAFHMEPYQQPNLHRAKGSPTPYDEKIPLLSCETNPFTRLTDYAN